MSNRQARREQSRTSRSARPARSTRPSSMPPKRSGGGPDLFSRPYLIGVGAVIVVLAVVLGVVASRGGGGESSSYVADLEKALAELPVDMASGNKLGGDTAPIKLTVFEDFQCPYCLKYTAEQEPALIEEYVKTGKMQIIYQHLPIVGKTESIQAAMASQCAADENKFWQYHSALFLVQAKAGQADPNNEKVDVGRFSNGNLKQYATDVGLDRSKFDTCLDGGAKLSGITDSQRQATTFGINGTPGFLINGRPIGQGTPGTLDEWRKALDALYTASSATATPSASAIPVTNVASPQATPTR